MGINFTNFFYKITICPANNIINSFKNNNIATNFSSIFLQFVDHSKSLLVYI